MASPTDVNSGLLVAAEPVVPEAHLKPGKPDEMRHEARFSANLSEGTAPAWG
jgi:hypothetical protein